VEAAQVIDESELCKYLTFSMGDVGYGIAIGHVTEIIGLQRITFVPGTPHYVRGVINLRGKVIPVMDVRARFGLPGREYDNRTCTIVVDVDGKPVGLIVDRVAEVADIPTREIEERPGLGATADSEYILGLGKTPDGVKILLDVERLVRDDAAMSLA